MLKQKYTKPRSTTTTRQNKQQTLEKNTLKEQASVAKQYGSSEANKGENAKTSSNGPAVSTSRTNKKTQIINIGDQRIEVINPDYVSDLESRLNEMEKKLRQVENTARRVHNHANTLTSEINSVKSNMPKWS